MRITTVRLRNWCQHPSLDVDFRAGLNGILGSNGRGKSNLLDAMRFALTGQSINPGAKAENLTWGAEKGYVEVTFVTGDTEYTIRRSIETSKVSLKFGETTIGKTAEVEEFLVRLLGANMDNLLDNVFIPQGKIDSILFARPSDRLKEFQQTFGLEQAAEAHKWLTQEASAYQVTAGLDEQLQTATQLVLTSHQEIEVLVTRSAERKAEITALEPAEKIIQRALEASRSAEAIRQADQRVTEATEEAKRQNAALAAASEQHESIQTQVSQVREKAEVAKKQLQGLELAVSQYAQATQLRQQLAEAEAALQKIPATWSQADLDQVRQDIATSQAESERTKAILDGRLPLPVVPQAEKLQVDVQRLTIELQQARADKAVSNEIVGKIFEAEQAAKHLDLASKGQCPTCGQHFSADLDALAATVARLNLEIKQMREQEEAQRTQKIKSLEQTLQQTNEQLQGILQVGRAVVRDQYEKSVNNLGMFRQSLAINEDFRIKHETAARTRDLLVAQLSGAPQQKPDEAPLAALRDFLGRFDQLCEDEDQAYTAKAVAAERAIAADAAKKQALETRERLGVSVDMPSQQELEVAKQQAVALGLARTALAELGQNLGIAKALAEQRESEVTRLRELLNRQAADAAWVAEVRKVRDVLHVTNLPALMMREYARILNVRIEHYLSVWESPFRMRLADDMSFRVTFEDGKELDAARLSGGQKIFASASFRLAMSDTFARSVGLLVFDEPSTYLDKDNIQHLQTLLLKLKEMSQHSGRQILIVTHEESLMSFLDHVVTV